MKATRLPSGSWRVQLTIDGKRTSITRPTKREAIKAAETRQYVHGAGKTVGQALTEYIKSHDGVFSPSTVAGYEKIMRNYLRELQPIRIEALTEKDVSDAINNAAKKYSPKTVHNAWGLYSAALSPLLPLSMWKIKLPKKRKPDIVIPTEDEMRDLLACAEGKPMFLPIQLAALCGLRRSEIAALRYEDVADGYIDVNKALVRDKDNVWRLKPPKTDAGYRRVKIPSNVKIIGERGIPITNLNPDQMTKYCLRLSDGKFSMHDLRHYYASVLLKLGIPNKYAAKMMGHSGDEMLKKVYQHIFKNSQIEYDTMVADKVAEVVAAHELHTEFSQTA